MKLILNLGCGKNILPDTPEIKYVHADMVNKPGILKLNITKLPYPWAPETFHKVYLFHTIEHIPAEKHPGILVEIRRILRPNGHLVISYPEFPIVAKNYLENKDNDRAWWATVIYGRGLTEWDRHKALMDTRYFSDLMAKCGYKLLSAKPEKKSSYNTIVIATPSQPLPTYEGLMKGEFEVKQCPSQTTPHSP